MTTPAKRRPNVIKDLRIDEVSSVDRGAGDGVRVMLTKRNDGAAVEKGRSPMGEINELVQKTVTKLRKRDGSGSKHADYATFFESMPQELREIAKAESRGDTKTVEWWLRQNGVAAMVEDLRAAAA